MSHHTHNVALSICDDCHYFLFDANDVELMESVVFPEVHDHISVLVAEQEEYFGADITGYFFNDLHRKLEKGTCDICKENAPLNRVYFNFNFE